MIKKLFLCMCLMISAASYARFEQIEKPSEELHVPCYVTINHDDPRAQSEAVHVPGHVDMLNTQEIHEKLDELFSRSE